MTAAVTDRGADAIRLLSAGQLAEQLDMSVRSVWRHVSAGELPAPIRVGNGRLVRFRFTDVKAYLDRQSQKASR